MHKDNVFNISNRNDFLRTRPCLSTRPLMKRNDVYCCVDEKARVPCSLRVSSEGKIENSDEKKTEKRLNIDFVVSPPKNVSTIFHVSNPTGILVGRIKKKLSNKAIMFLN